MASFQFESEPIPIKRVDDITGSTFNDIYKNKKPVILTGILREWLPMKTWTEEYIKNVLCEEFGDELTVLKSNDNKHFINHLDVSEKFRIPLKVFLNAVFHHESDINTHEPVNYYLRTDSMPLKLYEDLTRQGQVEALIKSIHCIGNKKILLEDKEGSRLATDNIQEYWPWEEFLDIGVKERGVKPELDCQDIAGSDPSPAHIYEDVDIPSNLPEAYHGMFQKVFKPSTMQLWLGTNGNVTPLHFDRNHGLLLQFIGRKELVLFSHSDTSFLYPYPSHTSRSHTSRINLRDLETSLKQFPRMRHAQRYTCVLHPGEILYTPPFWWHDVTSLDVCLSVTLPWDISLDELPLNMLM